MAIQACLNIMKVLCLDTQQFIPSCSDAENEREREGEREREREREL